MFRGGLMQMWIYQEGSKLHEGAQFRLLTWEFCHCGCIYWFLGQRWRKSHANANTNTGSTFKLRTWVVS